MQDQRIEDDQSEGRLSERDHDKAVLELLLTDGSPWTVEEIIREISGGRLDAIDAIARLAGAGLVHRLSEFVFPTRTARRADEIDNS
jgi:predicted transcriptional regulator